jgi:hypothetical protein
LKKLTLIKKYGTCQQSQDRMTELAAKPFSQRPESTEGPIPFDVYGSQDLG